MLNCHDATRLMSIAQERQLAFGEKVALKVHTMMCSGCRNFEKQMGAIRLMSHQYAKLKNIPQKQRKQEQE